MNFLFFFWRATQWMPFKWIFFVFCSRFLWISLRMKMVMNWLMVHGSWLLAHSIVVFCVRLFIRNFSGNSLSVSIITIPRAAITTIVVANTYFGRLAFNNLYFFSSLHLDFVFFLFKLRHLVAVLLIAPRSHSCSIVWNCFCCCFFQISTKKTNSFLVVDVLMLSYSHQKKMFSFS